MKNLTSVMTNPRIGRNLTSKWVLTLTWDAIPMTAKKQFFLDFLGAPSTTLTARVRDRADPGHFFGKKMRKN